jgi:hypothetical protein
MNQEEISRCSHCAIEMNPCRKCMIRFHTSRVKKHTKKKTEAQDAAAAKDARDQQSRDYAIRKKKLSPKTPNVSKRRVTKRTKRQPVKAPLAPISEPPSKPMPGTCLVSDCGSDGKKEMHDLCQGCFIMMQLWHKYDQKPDTIPMIPTGSQVMTFKRYFEAQKYAPTK